MVFLMIHRESTSGAYYLKTEAGGVAHTYCHMEDIPGCGSGGWTLVMKIDGEKVTFPHLNYNVIQHGCELISV